MTSVPVNSEAVSSVMARPRRVSTSHSGSAPRAGLASIGSYTTAHARGGARRRHQLRPRPRLRCDGPRAGGRGGTRGLRAHHLRRRRRRAGPRRPDGGSRERARPLPGRRGRPRTPVITWADTRSAAAALELRREHDERAIHARTGAPLHSAFFPAKLRWLRRARPEVFRRAAAWCGFGEYLQAQLIGTLSASLSMASGTGLLDQTRGRWDETMMEAAGIAAPTLPRIDDTAAPGLRPRWAARWPALARVPWHPARGDGACSNVGSDCWAPGGSRSTWARPPPCAWSCPSRSVRIPPPRGGSGGTGSTPRGPSWAAPRRKAATCRPGAERCSPCPRTRPRSSGRSPRCRRTATT